MMPLNMFFNNKHLKNCLILGFIIFCKNMFLVGQEIEIFKVKREEVFEFATKPTITKGENQIIINFETKGLCDVTVAIETHDGKIIRHLASGVLGKNAPEPFKKNEKKQSLEWDLKNDQAEYVKDFNNLNIRVSLGLKPKFEKNLFSDPKKRVTAWGSSKAQIISASESGVFVYQGATFDYLNQFDHNGEYNKTVYPFSQEITSKISDLQTHKFPQDQKELPLKKGFYQTTLLHGKSLPLNVRRGITGFNALGIANFKDSVALLGSRLIRLPVNADSAPLPLEGPEINFKYRASGGNADGKEYKVGPSSGAFSPNGDFLYLSGYIFRHLWFFNCMHGVLKVNYKTGETSAFAGKMNDSEKGSDNDKFNCAASVACDKQGRVYVADHMNNRIQIFSADGKFLKTIATFRPSKISIDPHNGDIYAFSWVIYNKSIDHKAATPVKPIVTHFGNFDSPAVKGTLDLPLPLFNGQYYEWTNALLGNGSQFDVEIDFWAKPYNIWISENQSDTDWNKQNIRIYQIKENKLSLLKDFGKDVNQTILRTKPTLIDRQRLYVNPKTGKLYLGEADGGVGKSFKEIVEIDPETNAIKIINIPFDSEDICFDPSGQIYLRTGNEIGRFDMESWREIPWDYGAEINGVSFESSSNRRIANLMSGLVTPGHRSLSFWHLGGMDVSLKGNLAITTCSATDDGKRESKWDGDPKNNFKYQGKTYEPSMFPGRSWWGEIHIYDKHGLSVMVDALPGAGHMNGLFIDKNNNLYSMLSGGWLINGKRYDPLLTDDLTDTLIKTKPGAAKIISKETNIAVPLPNGEKPAKGTDLLGAQAGGESWVLGAEWLYGGVGFAGKNAPWDSGGCCCWNARFCLDYFARSFVPELRRFSVAVLDTNGNLILRIGTYGNLNDGIPLVKDALSKNNKSIGNDEVAIFHGAYLATHTDKRLFISDIGNSRITSVKLDYYATEKVKFPSNEK
jgi:hypothetical protein